MANLTKIYSDIDFTFTKKPVTADVALSYDNQAVIRSIRNLLLTKKYEKPFNTSLGSRVDAILFENLSGSSADLLSSEIKRMVEQFEPRAIIKDIKVTENEERNAYNVSLSFYIENATQLTTVNLILERNR
jgi:hypothetical protein